MKWLITTILLSTGIQFLIASYIVAQELPSAFNLIDVDGAIGNTEGTLAVSFNLDENLGKKHRIVAGVGARFTSYLGKNQYYITAPAELTSGSTGPAVIFKENIDANIDTFLIKTAQVNSITCC